MKSVILWTVNMIMETVGIALQDAQLKCWQMMYATLIAIQKIVNEITIPVGVLMESVNLNA